MPEAGQLRDGGGQLLRGMTGFAEKRHPFAERAQQRHQQTVDVLVTDLAEADGACAWLRR